MLNNLIDKKKWTDLAINLHEKYTITSEETLDDILSRLDNNVLLMISDMDPHSELSKLAMTYLD